MAFHDRQMGFFCCGIGDLNLRDYPFILITVRISSVSRPSQENYVLTVLPYKYLPWTLLGKPQ